MNENARKPLEERRVAVAALINRFLTVSVPRTMTPTRWSPDGASHKSRICNVVTARMESNSPYCPMPREAKMKRRSRQRSPHKVRAIALPAWQCNLASLQISPDGTKKSPRRCTLALRSLRTPNLASTHPPLSAVPFSSKCVSVLAGRNGFGPASGATCRRAKPTNCAWT